MAEKKIVSVDINSAINFIKRKINDLPLDDEDITPKQICQIRLLIESLFYMIDSRKISKNDINLVIDNLRELCTTTKASNSAELQRAILNQVIDYLMK